MLDSCRAHLATRPAAARSLVHCIVGDMRTFTLPQRFPLVIAPFRAFLHNVTAADRAACLARVREHLRPGGRFAFNVFHPALEFMAQHAGTFAGVWRWRGTHARAGGGYVVRSEAVQYDTVRQVLHALHRYEEFGDSDALVGTSMHRLELAYLYPGDIRRELAAAGFQDVTIYGGFGEREVMRDNDELVVIAS
jgi:hypothetical protein